MGQQRNAGKQKPPKAKAEAKKTQEVREPTMPDAIDFVGILAFGAADFRFMMALENGDAGAALALLVTGALRDPDGREQLQGFLCDLWEHEATPKVLRAADPNNANDQGEVETLEEAKRREFSQLPPRALPEMIQSLRSKENFEDFLELVKELMPGSSGATSTESSADTAGQTST